MRVNIPVKTFYIGLISICLLAIVIFVAILLINRPEGEQGTDTKEACILDQNKHYFGSNEYGSTTTPGDIWIQYYLQPVLTGFEEEDGVNYLVGNLPDEDYNCVSVRFIFSGDIPIEDKSGLTEDFTQNFWVNYTIDFENLKNNLVIGEQVRIRYLAVAPNESELTESFCGQWEGSSQYYCMLQRVHQEYLGYEAVELVWNHNVKSYPVLYGTRFDSNITVIGE